MNRRMDLARTVARLAVELRLAKMEIEQLRNRRLPPKLERLRRRIAFYVHPDRGGDAETMRDVNLLFDHL